MLFTYKHFLVYLHLWSAWCAATIRSFCSLSKNDPICTIVCDKFPRLHKEKRRKEGTVRDSQIKAMAFRFCCYVRFLSIELQKYKFWYTRVRRCTTDQFEGYPSLGFIFSIFGRHINHQQHYLSFEGERYRSRKCDFKCFSNVIKTAYINDKKKPINADIVVSSTSFCTPVF